MEIKMNTNKKTARMAGVLYLMFMVTLIFASAGVQDRLIVFGDAEATARNIMANELLFRIGFMSELLSAAFFLLAAWALYALLKPVNKNLALLFVLLNLGGVAIQCVSLLTEFAALLVLGGADYLIVFQADQLQALAMLFLNIYKNGFMISQLFFATWLFPLGYLVFKSGFLPRILGIILMIECFAWLIYFFQFFFFPGHEWITNPCMAVGFIAEFGLTLWLLIMGAKDQAQYKSAHESA
jgi:hypothetical protein